MVCSQGSGRGHAFLNRFPKQGQIEPSGPQGQISVLTQTHIIVFFGHPVYSLDCFCMRLHGYLNFPNPMAVTFRIGTPGVSLLLVFGKLGFAWTCRTFARMGRKHYIKLEVHQSSSSSSSSSSEGTFLGVDRTRCIPQHCGSEKSRLGRAPATRCPATHLVQLLFMLQETQIAKERSFTG